MAKRKVKPVARPLVTETEDCPVCGQKDVPVLPYTRTLTPHRAPGRCCAGLNCSHAKTTNEPPYHPLRPLCLYVSSAVPAPQRRAFSYAEA